MHEHETSFVGPFVEVVRDPCNTLDREILLPFGKTLFGRHPECDVVLPSKDAHRHWFLLTKTDVGVHIEDLRSGVRIYINGEEMRGGLKEPKWLRDGDQLDFGDYTLLYRERASREGARYSPKMMHWDLYATKTDAIDALACHDVSPNWKPMPPSLGIVTRDGDGITNGRRPHFFVIDEVDMVTCIEISYEGVSWEWENERVYEQLDPVIALISEHGRHRILVDCARLDYLDRCLLSILIQFWKALFLVNGRFAFCNVNRKILDVFLAMKFPVRLASEHQ